MKPLMLTFIQQLYQCMAVRIKLIPVNFQQFHLPPQKYLVGGVQC